jgi:hypothetical protein
MAAIIILIELPMVADSATFVGISETCKQANYPDTGLAVGLMANHLELRQRQYIKVATGCE